MAELSFEISLSLLIMYKSYLLFLIYLYFIWDHFSSLFVFILSSNVLTSWTVHIDVFSAR